MGFDKLEMIKQLKFEIEIIEKGGYYPSVREPRQLSRLGYMSEHRARRKGASMLELLLKRVCAARGAQLEGRLSATRSRLMTRVTRSSR